MRLFKYRTFDEKGRWRDILTNNRLYFSQPSSLNDPFECRPMVVANGTPAEISAYAKQIVSRRIGPIDNVKAKFVVADIIEGLSSPELREESYRKQVEGYGILSFSALPNSALQWAHYGGNHSGLCFEFDIVESTFPPEENGIFRVSYSRDRPVVDALKTVDPSAHDAMLTNGLLTKSADWAYEKEYRVIRFDGYGLATFLPSALTGVILGMRITDEHKNELFTLLSKRNPKPSVRKVVLDPSKYKLNLESVLL